MPMFLRLKFSIAVLYNLINTMYYWVQSRKFCCADDVALSIEVYFRNLDFKFKQDGTLHLNNKLTNMKINVHFESTRLGNNRYSKYLGITLNRTLFFSTTPRKLFWENQNFKKNIIQKRCLGVQQQQSLALWFSAADSWICN